MIIVNRYIKIPNNSHSIQRTGGHVRRARRDGHLLYRIMVSVQWRVFTLFNTSVFVEIPNPDGFVTENSLKKIIQGG